MTQKFRHLSKQMLLTDSVPEPVTLGFRWKKMLQNLLVAQLSFFSFHCHFRWVSSIHHELLCLHNLFNKAFIACHNLFNLDTIEVSLCISPPLTSCVGKVPVVPLRLGRILGDCQKCEHFCALLIFYKKLPFFKFFSRIR